MLRLLPADVCAMDAATRAAFEFGDAVTDSALDDMLLGHRKMMCRHHLAPPLSL